MKHTLEGRDARPYLRALMIVGKWVAYWRPILCNENKGGRSPWSRSLIRTCVAGCLVLILGAVHGQAGELDPSFNPLDAELPYGADDFIYGMAVQPDGKIFIGGDFNLYNGVVRNSIARLNADGTLDTLFNPGMGANSLVYALAAQPDGKVLIGGQFTFCSGVARNKIARYNSDGSLDLTFDPETGADQWVGAMALQPDGRILIGGVFTSYNGVPRNYIARLHADGSLDPSFDPGMGTNAYVGTMTLQSDGKLLIGGEFTTCDEVGRNHIARLNSDGSLDSSFDPGEASSGGVYNIGVQPDGKIVIGGIFTSFDGVGRNNIARVDSLGILDHTFDPGAGADGAVWILALQPDGKVVIGGHFNSFDGTLSNRIARLNADGSMDPDFNTGTGANQDLFAMAVLPDDKLLIAGHFTVYDAAPWGRIARLFGDDLSTSVGDQVPCPELRVVPNPVSTTLRLEGITGRYQWSVTDMQGRILLRGEAHADHGRQIDVSTLATGSYLLHTLSGGVDRAVRFSKL